MRFFKVPFLFFLIFLSFPSNSSSQIKDERLKEEIKIEAETLEYERATGTFKAKGEVVVFSGQRIFKADDVRYNENTKEIFAEGNVFLQDGEDTIICARLYFEMEKRTGHIENGRIFIRKGNYHISGDSIEKRGENVYCVKKGFLTTCSPEKPDWKFTAKNADIVVGGYAKLKGAKFHILDVPFFYLPWGIFPVKTERETGLLFPEIRISSRDGFIFSPSLFWAIERDKDATFYLHYIEERGIRPGIEFRYATREDKKGEWFTSILDDMKYKHTRYELRGEHEENLRSSTLFKAKIRHVSDIDYLKDFGDKPEERSESLLKSNAYVEQKFGRSYLTGEVSYFRNLREKDNEYTFKHLPFLSFFLDPVPIFKERFLFGLNSDFINFYREKGVRYSRFNVEPSISFFRSFSGFNLKIQGTYYGKLYFMEKDSEYKKRSEEIETLKFEGSLNTYLQKNYYPLRILQGEVQSLIKPEVRWIYIPKRSFRDVPYIDPSDRIFETNVLTYSFAHYLNVRGDNPYEVSTLELEQSFSPYKNLEPSTLYEGYGRRFSDIKARFRFYGIKNLGFTNESVINIYGDALKKMINELSYKIFEGADFYVSHTYTKDLSHELYFDMKGKYKDFYGKYGIRYSFFNHEWVDTLYEIAYSPLCWSLNLRLTQTKRPKDTSIKINFDLKGITDKGR
jgi:LPS-assembly protein